MKPVVRITQQGFTHCPSCSQFIKITESASQTVCPFCEAPLRESVKAKPSAFGSKLKLFGRGALLAGALMGASVLSACGDTTEEEVAQEDAGTDAGEEDMGEEDIAEEDVFNPNNSQSDYGGSSFEEEPAYPYVMLQDATPEASGEFPGMDIDAIGVESLESGESFAFFLEDYSIPLEGNSASDPNQVLGPPDADCDAQSGKFTSLGGMEAGGYVVVGFQNAFYSGDTIRVYELGGTLCLDSTYEDDPGAVFVSFSSDLGSFIEAGTVGTGQFGVLVP